jgi:hypothetical protein
MTGRLIWHACGTPTFLSAGGRQLDRKLLLCAWVLIDQVLTVARWCWSLGSRWVGMMSYLGLLRYGW